MKYSSRSLIKVLGLGLVAVAVSGCAGKGYRGKMTKAGEAVLESKQNATVAGTVMLEDHYGGILASGKLTGLRADRTYKVVLAQKGDCSARNASSAGAVVAEVSRDGKPAVDKDGGVAGHAKGQSLKGAIGKAVVIVASNDEAKTEFRVACGIVKETMKGAQCADCGMKGCKNCDSVKGKTCADCGMKGCKCGTADCKCKKMKKSEMKPTTTTTRSAPHRGERTTRRPAPINVY